VIFKKIKARDASGRHRYRRAAHLMKYVEKIAADGGQLEGGAAYLKDRGFLNDADADAHIAEMQGLIHSCAKARAPTRHYVMSWQDGERPTPAQVDQAVDIFLNATPCTTTQSTRTCTSFFAPSTQQRSGCATYRAGSTLPSGTAPSQRSSKPRAGGRRPAQ